MMNSISIMGRLTADPESRESGSGIPFCKFSVAVDRDYKNKNGEKETDFFNCVAWRNTSAFIEKYVKKGTMVGITGRMQNSPYLDDHNKKRSYWTLQVESIYFAESKKEQRQDQAGAGNTDEEAGYHYTAPLGFTELEGDDSDLPF